MAIYLSRRNKINNLGDIDATSILKRMITETDFVFFMLTNNAEEMWRFENVLCS